ncbi:hypothetical protein [Novosphingobium terrae]|uniref:hypothetical protein n=1 Tax=Novosphingobium terrae TaxID=2726189 RepID=UPI00197EE3EF|nr:hypothetical protein [Novosphingobium terrae]
MITRFQIRAEAEAASLVRLLDPFAQRGLVPSAVSATCVDDDLEVVIDMPLLDEGIAAQICARMGNMIAVLSASAKALGEQQAGRSVASLA